MNEPITRERLLEAAMRARRPGISHEQAVLIGFAELNGEPLDPERFDDAAILLRSERLFLDGFLVSDAIDAARAERTTWNYETAT